MKRLLPVLTGCALLLFSSTQGWGLPPCDTDNQMSTWTNCFGIWTVSSGDHEGFKYVGEFKDGKPHGKGTQTFSAPHESAGDKYVGEFKDNKRHGHGTYRHNSGNKYVGGYKDDKKHGQGTVTFANGDIFVGTFKDGKVRWSQKMGKLNK